MKILNNIVVEMNRRGAAAVFNILSEDATGNKNANFYSLLVGTSLVRVSKNYVNIIEEDDVLDPLHPKDVERSLIVMSKDLEDFDVHLYDLACGLSILFNNDASEDYAVDWLTKQIEEAVRSED